MRPATADQAPTAALTPERPPAAPTSAARPVSGDGRPPFRVVWRRWRTAAIIVAIILVGGILMALLTPVSSPANSYLDPASTGPAGTRALADILTDRGTAVDRVSTPGGALAAVRHGAGALLITSPRLLSDRQLTALAAAPVAVLILVEPDQAALTALTPGVLVDGSSAVAARPPGCTLQAATLAGSADMGGIGLGIPASVAATAACYRSDGQPTLAVFTDGPRVVTILGIGAPLENQYLAQLGNAALALNLLGTQSRIAWLVPQPAVLTAPAGAGRQSIWPLIPRAAYLVAIELAIAVLLAAAWRSRRLGPLVPEKLPVVVRASETVEGHARLYQTRRARDRAASALRDATIARIAPAIGLAAGTAAPAVTAALETRSGLDLGRIGQLLYGPAPRSDSELVRLAEDLDALEREVRAR
jgi:hypothetical protein